MESLETKFAKAMDKLTESQAKTFFSEVTKRKRATGQALTMESQLNLVESIIGGKKITESISESAPIRRNNGAFQESGAGPEMSDLQERQVKAFRALGFSEVEALATAGVYDRELKVAAFQGKTAGQFFESIRESSKQHDADLKARQQKAFGRMGRR